MATNDLAVKKRRYIIFSNITALVMLTCLMVGVAIMTVNAYYSLTVRNTLVDCVEPNGECYREGAQRSQSVVERLLKDGIQRETTTRQVVIIAALCAEDQSIRRIDDPAARIVAMEKCVNDEIEKKEAN